MGICHRAVTSLPGGAGGNYDVEFPRRPGPKTDMGWGIDPRGLTELLLRVSRARPDLDLMITENGAAFPDVVGADGVVHDDDRVEYLRGHLAAVHAAIAAGARVTGGTACGRCSTTSSGRGGTASASGSSRRLRDAGAHAEGQRPVLRGGGAGERGARRFVVLSTPLPRSVTAYR